VSEDVYVDVTLGDWVVLGLSEFERVPDELRVCVRLRVSDPVLVGVKVSDDVRVDDALWDWLGVTDSEPL
jgi:hypothetical protein